MRITWFIACLFLIHSNAWAVQDPSEEMNHLLERIQDQWMNKKPGYWNSDLYACDVRWSERLSGMRSPARYIRKIRQTPDRTFLIAENWQIVPSDLPAFMAHWGLNEVKDWDQFTFEMGKNRIFAVPEDGLICVWRFYPSLDQAWKTPPYLLGNLTHDKLVAKGGVQEEHRVREFFSDVLLEEILDRDGLGISISKTWHLRGEFSRFTGKVRLLRSIRLNVNGLYSVFDTLYLGTEGLLGNVIEKNKTHFYSEIGPFLGLNKEITYVHSGYKTWYEALFSATINPRDLPFSEKNIRKLPTGIRVIFPHEATLALIAKTRFNYFNSSDISQKLQTGLSVKGTVTLSMTKLSEDRVLLKVGGRLEKLFDAYFDMYPDFNGADDPLRLLFGSLVRLRFEGGRGKRVYLEKEINLNSEPEMRLLRKALKHGMLLKGVGFGFKTALYFIFHPNQERPQDYFLRNIPEIEWDSALIGAYKTRETYGKIGSRPISYRRSTEMVSDRWHIYDYRTQSERAGHSLRIQSISNRRWIKGSHSRDLLIYGLIPEHHLDHTLLTLIDMTRDGSWTSKRLQTYLKNWETRIGTPLALSDSAKAEIPGHYARMGFRLQISLEALQRLQRSGILSDLFQNDPDWKPILARHRYLSLKLKSALKEKNRFLLARTAYKFIKKGLPLHPLLALLEDDEYRLEWMMENREHRIQVQDHIGHARMSRQQVLDWNWWEEKQGFEDIFVDVSLTND